MTIKSKLDARLNEHIDEPITTNDEGWADFRCQAGSVSVWVPQSDPQSEA
ncbi:MAG: hypothetical protein AAF171_27125 [Cyanobacteria bacterium P01_A01_bin.116]